MTYPFPASRRAAIRPSPVFLAVLAITAASGAYVWNIRQLTGVSATQRAAAFVFVIAGWIVTLCLHEFAHAFLAWRFGDDEVEARGYLTLNPLKYSHPLLSIVLPLFFIATGGIGMPGGAVFVHPGRFRTRVQRAAMSASGPLVNLVAAVVLLVAFRTWAGDAHPLFWYALAFLALLQVSATLLNLLPVPGLDGYGAIEPYLAPQTQRAFEQFKPFGMLALFAVLSVRQVNIVFFDAVYWLYELSGVDRVYAYGGSTLVRFWLN